MPKRKPSFDEKRRRESFVMLVADGFVKPHREIRAALGSPEQFVV
jgi:hypothetical protein